MFVVEARPKQGRSVSEIFAAILIHLRIRTQARMRVAHSFVSRLDIFLEDRDRRSLDQGSHCIILSIYLSAF